MAGAQMLDSEEEELRLSPNFEQFVQNHQSEMLASVS